MIGLRYLVLGIENLEIKLDFTQSIFTLKNIQKSALCLHNLVQVLECI